MSIKIQKLREEREKNETKMTALRERNRELERKIAEEEGLELRALMRNEKINMDELVSLLRARKENPFADASTGDMDDDFDIADKKRKDEEDDEYDDE